MPGISGRELACRLAERHPGVRVLFVSGFPGEEMELGGTAARTTERSTKGGREAGDGSDPGAY